MKNFLITLISLCFITLQSKSQTYDKVFIDSSETGRSLKIEYTLDNSKILHFKITAQSDSEFIQDVNTYENQVVFILNDNLEHSFYYEFDESSFPYGSPATFTGSFDLSNYTISEISQFQFEGRFDFKYFNESYQDYSYKSISKQGAIQP